MRWVEKPVYSEAIKNIPDERQLYFNKMGTFKEGDGGFEEIRETLREGDVIAYHMEKNEARMAVLKGKLTRAGYRLLDYGHLAILTGQSGGLRLFSSHSFKGPNTAEGVETLEDHSFDVYRLNRWEKVDKARFHEFVVKSQEKAGNWIGYDFSGMFGLWNSNLSPDKAEDIGHDYICSTIVAAALYYAGADMKVSNRKGVLDLVSPKQVVASRGVLRELSKR
jgi:hypothetical protein